MALASIAGATMRCGGSPFTVTPGSACTSGSAVACTGPGGCPGVEVCGSDGGVAACECAGPDGGVPDATVVVEAGSGPGDGGPTSADTSSPGCAGGKTTSISGKVYDPGNFNPVYGAAVYVPGVTPLPLLPPGEPCGSCASLYASPETSAVTAVDGTFRLTNVPAGTAVPLVVQLGKWRRLFTIPTVTACEDNPQIDRSLRLPRSHVEGDIPNFAVSTGGADTLECLFVRMGMDPAEYEPGADGPGRIHIFQGGTTGSGGLAGGVGPNTSPAGPPSYTALWNDDADIKAYDVVMLSCEGAPTTNMNQQVLLDYASAGGRLFASHFHYAWFDTGPFATLMPPLATWTPGTNLIANGTIGAVIEATTTSGGGFPAGLALKQWLGDAGALGTGGVAPGELPIASPRHNANITAVNSLSTGWIVPDPMYTPPDSGAGPVQYFSFDTPLGAATGSACGRFAYSDMHLTGGAATGITPDYASAPTVPAGCVVRPMTPEETALEFMLFDLSSCVVPIGQSPTPPAVP